MPRPSEKAFSAAVERIYSAATDLRVWPEALETARRAVGAEFAQIQFRAGSSDGERLQHFFPAGAFDPKVAALYRERYFAEDPWAAIARRLPVGRVALSSERLPEAELVRQEFYHEILRPQRPRGAIPVPAAISASFDPRSSFQMNFPNGPFAEKR